MIGPNKERIIVTLPKDQVKFIRKMAKKNSMSMSEVVKWLIQNNIGKIISNVFLNEQERRYLNSVIELSDKQAIEEIGGLQKAIEIGKYKVDWGQNNE